jgi:dUTP pyrophosphatase
MGRESTVSLPVTRVEAGARLPTYAHSGDAGLDLRCLESVTLAPAQRTLVRTGIAVAIPAGHAGLVIPRSGRAIRDGLSLVNTPGLIDSGYRGEVKIALINHDREHAITLNEGDRIAQLVIVPYVSATVVEVETLDVTERDQKGFGSSGE